MRLPERRWLQTLELLHLRSIRGRTLLPSRNFRLLIAADVRAWRTSGVIEFERWLAFGKGFVDEMWAMQVGVISERPRLTEIDVRDVRQVKCWCGRSWWSDANNGHVQISSWRWFSDGERGISKRSGWFWWSDSLVRWRWFIEVMRRWRVRGWVEDGKREEKN